MVKCKYEGTGIWNGRCTGTKEVDPCPGYDKCKQYNPNYTTNADRIRSMNDEELAEFLWDFNLADVSTGKIGEFGPHMFRYRLKEWLHQPAE